MDFIDAMLALDDGKKVIRTSWLNCYWEKQADGLYREKFYGEAACAGSTLFKFEHIDEEQREATDWEIYNN